MKGIGSKILVLFRSPDLFRAFWVGETMKDFVAVGERFQIRRLLFLLSREQRFYLLALSQKHVRLFRCTHHSAREIQLRGHVPTNLHEWRQTAKPDHVVDNRASAGPSVGSMKGVMFGTSTVREQQDEYLLHFFKQIDKGLHRLLAREVAPLIVAGVEFEIALYRKVNTYPQLTEHAVHGSPDGLSARELHERALTFVKQTFSAPLKKALEDFEEYGGTRRASSSLDEILRAADEGRVADLLLREGAERRGSGPGEEDLFNLAALRTVSHRGQAFALKASEMPGELDAAAIFRF